MRKVLRKKAMLPEALHNEGTRAAKDALTEYYRLSAEERSRRRPPLNPKIWTSESVRDGLSRIFLSKCAYCESPVDRDQRGEVTHHRPTGNAISDRDRPFAPEGTDHYSWFAYEWENLFLSCAECNRSKRNFFPLNGPRARLRCTWSEAETSEQALLINPCRSEPRKHLQFWINGTVIGVDEVGSTTVNVLSLDRSNLTQARSNKFRQCLIALEHGRHDRQELEIFRRELSEDAPFSGAARIAFFELFTDFADMVGLPKPSFRIVVDDVIRIAMTVDDSQWQQLQRLTDPAPVYFDRLDVPMDAEEYRQVALRSRQTPRTSQLRRISIRNFKGVSQLDLEIPQLQPNETGAPCMMLLGENSTGKSTTLQAISLALMGQTMRSRMGVSAEDFLPREVSGWQLDDTVTPEVTLEFDTGEPVRLHIDPLTKQFTGDEHPTMVLFAFGSRRFFGKDIIRRQHASTLRSLFDPFAKLQHPGRWLQGLSSENFNALARAMREVLVLQEEDSIGRDGEGRLFVRAHGRDTPLEQLSDGYRSLMAMVLDVMRGMLEVWGDLENARGLVLIDEIETHLHPRWKLRVVSALRRAMPNVQFVATTHDPLCLRGMRGGEVQVLVRNDNQQIQALAGLPDVRGMRAEQLLTSDYFGLSSTADPDVEEALERLALPASARTNSTNRNQEALRPFQWLGDTPFEQVFNEALRRFIDEAAASSEIDRGQVREAAVNNVLERLRTLRARRPS